ncbi:MAG TPA: glycoside hydrolase family 15 protein [Rhabdochlamydiaceae bacterium]|jgi:oligosaccharide amylase
MPRDIPIGNGSLLIAYDKNYLLREFYFPHVGEESHTASEPFRLGVWVNGKFSWVPDGWRIQRDYLDDSLITQVQLLNDELNIHLLINDLVDFHEDIYLRKIIVENLAQQEREVRLFFGQDFNIYGNDIGDTAAFRPENSSLLHYKGARYFLINIYANAKWGIENYATGNKEREFYQGTWKDAEDGVLSNNPIAQGSVDSVIGITLRLPPQGKETCFYWICAGTTWNEVKELNDVVRRKTPPVIFKRTQDYWKLWIDKEKLNENLLSPKIHRLFIRSLLILRTQIDNSGSIISGADTDVIQFNRDTYAYMWTRDASLAAYALDLSGYYESSRNYFNLCAKIIDKEGYFLHKYTPSGLLASSWHPWQRERKAQIPIQEDETALVIWALWEHYQICKDVEFIKPLYKPLIKKAADFLMNYRDHKTGLPLPSYDLWEERQGILTYTCATVYGGLNAAAHFTEAFGESELAQEYREGASHLRAAMDKYLYLEKEKRFARMINFTKEGSSEIDSAVDASLFALFAFGAYSPQDEKVKSTMQQIQEKLWCKTQVGGVARYENDSYYRVSPEVAGNPWFITTLWLAQYHIALAQNKEELSPALRIIEWVADHALPSGVLAEQVNPFTNEPLSVSPLTWSHATFIIVVQEYLNKFLDVEKCDSCGMPKYLKKACF